MVSLLTYVVGGFFDKLLKYLTIFPLGTQFGFISKGADADEGAVQLQRRTNGRAGRRTAVS